MTTPVEAARIEGMSLEEFVRRFDEERFELVDGEIIVMSPTRSQHTIVLENIKDLLKTQVTKHNYGRVFSETTYVLPDTSRKNWVKGSRIPDIMVVSWDKYRAFKKIDGWRDMPMMFIPDFVVEVLSPTDSYSEVLVKVGKYFADGVKLVCVVDARKKNVVVHVPGKEPAILTEKETITGSDVLPDFSAKVSQFFED